GGMVQNVTVGQELGYLRVPPGLLVDVGELQRLPAERVALITTGSQAEPLSALTRIAMNDHKQVTVGPGDTVIFSSKMIPGNEKPIFDVTNHLNRPAADVQYETVADLHVPGPPSQ